MYPSVQRELPQFITNYLVFSDCFVNVNKEKTCLVLTRNLKFFEFQQKQLKASIDLNETCLNKHKQELLNYKGPKGKCYEPSSLDGDDDTTRDARSIQSAMNISFGKYVCHVINTCKIYIIIQCWDKCVILKRLPEFKGFEVIAEYEDIQSYRLTHGQIKYCPLVEFKFHNNDILKTDFEDEVHVSMTQTDFNEQKTELKQLLDRVKSAKTELHLHKSITAHSFERLQNKLTHGLPYLRSIKLEEKQILSRCGDIWMRLTPHDDLVIGTPLVNQCAPPNLTIIRNLQPILQPQHSSENSIQFQYRLFQLKQKFDQLDSLETFLQTEDEQLQGHVWKSNENLEILPDSFVVLLIKFKISQIVSLKQCPIILTYEVLKDIHSTNDTTKKPTTMSLQIFLQNIDFHTILHHQRSQHELKFQTQTLHQDFLTIAMISHETNLIILFEFQKDLEFFEDLLQKKFDFVKPKQIDEDAEINLQHHSIFYNPKSSSLWFGCLLLRQSEIPDDDDGQCQTTWKIYCQNPDKTLLFIRILLSELLTLHCNILSIENCAIKPKDTKSIGEFENAIRQELLQLQQLQNDQKSDNFSEKYCEIYTDIYETQMKSDVLAKDLMKN